MSDEPAGQTSEAPASRPLDVFISHSSADSDIARKLANRLAHEGLNVWFDEFRSRPGVDWQREIREAVEQSRMCLILVSGNALASRPWVSQEWSEIQACSWRRNDFSIFPVKLDDTETPPFLRNWQVVNLEKHATDPAELDRLVGRIVLFLSRGGPAKASASDSDQSTAAERFAEIQQALGTTEEDISNRGQKAGSDG